ncbi:MAG: efflux RND transporter periplasmic adaptor subunit [Candidatus Omnitrophota bacterium]
MDTVKKPNKRMQMVVIACLVLGGFFLLKGFFRKKPPAEIPARPVETAVAFAKDAPVYLESFGNLYSLNDVDIKSQVDGKIKEINFIEGSDVRKGDLLVTIDPAPFQAALDKARAALNQNLADLKLKKVTFERNKVLFNKQLISRQDFDKYSADLASAEAQVRLDAANVDIAKINLDYCYIRSPVDGLSGKRQVDLGNIVKANDGPVLVNIKTIDQLYVDFTVTEADLDRVREAMKKSQLKVEIYSDESPDKTYSGELSLLDNSVDNNTGTFLLRAIVPNKERSLWAGQFVKVRLILVMESNAVQVPYDAVQLGQNGSYLFAVSPDNKADLRMVKTGNRQQDNIVIKEGVRAGEKVVTSGQMGLSPGMRVVDVAELKIAEEKANK